MNRFTDMNPGDRGVFTSEFFTTILVIVSTLVLAYRQDRWPSRTDSYNGCDGLVWRLTGHCEEGSPVMPHRPPKDWDRTPFMALVEPCCPADCDCDCC